MGWIEQDIGQDWSVEEFGYSLIQLKDIFIRNLKNNKLPITYGYINVDQESVRGAFEFTYQLTNPDLYLSFVVDLSYGVSVDKAIDVGPKRQGFGTSLDTTVEGVCADLGISKIILTNIEPNSKQFWEKLGYIDSVKILNV